ncbi:MAG: rhodanese-like domain-containing protein [Roseovarius sp.]|nr:rhodanese-like domain-containing protein [Roseovarius sp.]
MTSITRLLALPALALGLSLALPATTLADSHGAMIETSVVEAELPEKKVNTKGRYITAAESIALLDARDDVALVDIRSPEETMFVGYASETDMNIPFKLVDPAHPFNAKKNAYGMIDNPDFIEDMKGFIAANDPSAVLIICRSGARSARAVDALAEAGVQTPAYTVIDGFEGDKSDDGRRSVNGWKNVGGEWTYKLRDGLLPADQ